jgi:hypothetical protein
VIPAEQEQRHFQTFFSTKDVNLGSGQNCPTLMVNKGSREGESKW